MKLSELLERPVMTRDGRKVGHLLDLRAVPSESAGLRVLEGIYGGRGFLEKIGFGKGHASSFAWQQVVAIEPDRIVIDEQSPSRAG